MYTDQLQKKIITNYKFIEMKKLLLLFILAGSFIGCSSDDNTPVTNNHPSSLTGTWKSISFTYKGKTVDTSNCENTNNESAYFWTFVFSDDNTFKILYTCDLSAPSDEFGTYSYTNGTLTNTHVGDWVNKYKVTTIDDNKIGIKLFWSNTSNDVDGEYMILQKQ